MRGQVTLERRCRNTILLLTAQSWYQTDYDSTRTAIDCYYDDVRKKIKRGKRRPKSQKPSPHPQAGKWYQTAYNSTCTAIDRYYDDVRKKIKRGKRLPKFIPKKLFSPHPPDDKHEDETFEKVSAKFAVKNLELVRGLISENRQFDDILIKFGKACESVTPNKSDKLHFARLFSLATKIPDFQKLSNKTVASLVLKISSAGQQSRAEIPNFDDLKRIKAKLFTAPKVADLNLDSDPLIAMCKTKYKGQAQWVYIASQVARELSQHCQLLSTLGCIRSACQNLLKARKSIPTISWTADVLAKFNSSLNNAQLDLLKRYNFHIVGLLGNLTDKSHKLGNEDSHST